MPLVPPVMRMVFPVIFMMVSCQGEQENER